MDTAVRDQILEVARHGRFDAVALADRVAQHSSVSLRMIDRTIRTLLQARVLRQDADFRIIVPERDNASNAADERNSRPAARAGA